MKTFVNSLRLTIVFCVFFSIFYILILWIYGQFVNNNHGNAEVVTLNGKVVGAANVGQQFTKDTYFWGRPSCAGDGYDASSSCGSNKGPTNPDYLKEVQGRIDDFLKKNPTVKRSEVPAELVEASGSGLDPEISKASAMVQVARVAKARHMSEAKVKEIVDANTKGAFLGLFGPSDRVNVLKLNVALDEAK